VTPDELASYCVHALGGAGAQRTKAAVRRLVSVTMDALRPRRWSPSGGGGNTVGTRTPQVRAFGWTRAGGAKSSEER
jgi:hypothetical protein